jgi:anti-sigma B factor antagonist
MDRRHAIFLPMHRWPLDQAKNHDDRRVTEIHRREPSMGNPSMSKAKDDFKLEWHGNAVVITPAANVEAMRWDLIEQAADIVMGPLRNQEVPMVVFDLSDVGYFGSVFLALLLRCHKLVKSRGGELVLCGASDLAKELLRVTALDTLWAIYETREQALEAVAT